MRICVLLAISTTVWAASEIPSPANAFVNSVGVNVHLAYTDSIYYQNFPIVLQALRDLHVNHVRDGLVDFGPGASVVYSNHQALAKAGVRCDFIVGFEIPKSTVEAWPSRVSDIEAFEAANEADVNGHPNWASDLKTELGWLYDAARSAEKPLIGPSLMNASSYRQLGNIAQLMRFNNLHNYFGGFYPETPGWGGADKQGHAYGSIAWNLDQTAIDGPGIPVWTTETGYDVNPLDNGSVPPEVYATYIGRLLFAHWNAGIKRTFLYQLADDPSTRQWFGLMDKSGTRRPAFTALASLLNLLEDPGPPFAPRRVEYTIPGDVANVQHTLLQKRDGTVFLALWAAQPIYDPNTKTPISAAPKRIVVSIPPTTESAFLYTYDRDWRLAPASLAITKGKVSFPITANVALLKLTADGRTSPH